MAQDRFNDIVPSRRRRSIQNIRRFQDAKETPGLGKSNRILQRRMPGATSLFARYGIWFVALIVLVLLVVAFSLIFAGSKVVIVPKQTDITVSGVFTAFREPLKGQLAFEIIDFEETASQKVDSSGVQNVEERASGTIIVFNDFSQNEQRLITNTRFEASDGHVYRIRESIVVPGQQKDEAGQLIPGSVEVLVYADEPGESYNMGLTDFTIPGFKGAPQYEKFYARSKTSMEGGFVGERAVVEEDVLTSVIETLQAKLREDLSVQARANVPDGFEFFESGLSITFSEPEINEMGTTQAEVTQTARGSAVIFERGAFAQEILSKTTAGYEGEPAYLQTIDALSLSLSDDVSLSERPSEINFSLNGKAHAIWMFDEPQLQRDLSGRSKDALPTILSGYPGIQEAEMVLRPFWRQSFPDEPDKISIVVKLESLD